MELTIISLLIGSLLVLPSFSASNKPNGYGAYVIIQVDDTETKREFSRSIELNLKVYPQRQAVKEHENVAFDCRDESDLRAPIHWFRESKLPLSSSAVVGNGRLAIYGVQPQDAGVYICEAIDQRARTPGQRVKVNLEVEKAHAEDSYEDRETQDSPGRRISTEKIVTKPRTFSGTNQLNLKIYPKERRALENRAAIFDCRDEGDLHASVNWLRGNNLPLPSGAKVANGRLMLPRVQRQDAGEYICEASGYSSSTPGQRVKFTLEVNPSRIQTHGFYSKTQTGKFGTTAIPIETRVDQLDLRIYLENRAVKENEDVVFVCRDESDQHAAVNWRRGNNLSLPLTSEVINGWIKIRRVQLHDAGEYFCEASGYSSSTLGQRVKFTLAVERTGIPQLNCGSPGGEIAESGERKLKIHPPYPLVKLHSEVTLNCYDEGYLPVSVHWRREDNAALPSGAVVRNGCLTIPEVESEDAGIYICEATGNPRSTLGQLVDVILLIEKPEMELIIPVNDLK